MEATAFRLTTRDRQILETLQRFHELDRVQIQTLFFSDNQGGLRHANRRLSYLKASGLIQPMEQWVPQGVLQRPTLWTLTIEGEHLLGGTRRSREDQRGGIASEHTRLSNSISLRLYAEAKRRGWVAQVEPEIAVRAAAGLTHPIPDGRVTIETPDGKFVFLIECDRGNEERAKLTTRFRSYLDRQDGLKDELGTNRVRVLFVTHARRLMLPSTPEQNARRAENVIRYLQVLKTGKFILVTTEDQFFGNSPLTNPIWLYPGAKHPVPIFQ